MERGPSRFVGQIKGGRELVLQALLVEQDVVGGIVDACLEAQIGDGPHVEMRRGSEDGVTGLGLSGEKERSGERDERRVDGLGVGGSGGAGVAVRGAERVEEIELLQEESLAVERGEIIGGAAAHDTGADHDDVEGADVHCLEEFCLEERVRVEYWSVVEFCLERCHVSYARFYNSMKGRNSRSKARLAIYNGNK